MTIAMSYGQTVQQRLPDKTRILFLLDGSGSMFAKWGDTDRMSAAKELLGDLVDSLRTNQNLELALRAYGHLYSRQARNCQDTKLEVGFAKANHDQIIRRLGFINPKGTTPIAYSLEQAANDFPDAQGYRNIVIIITDGIESCDGDPCAVSLALQRKGIFLKPFVIGIGMGKEYQKQFGCIGEYFDAEDVDSFKKALGKALSTSLDPTTVSIELLDENDRPTETDVVVSFINNFTQWPVSDFVHYRDRQGRPDSLEIDAVLTYDLMVGTIPPVMKRNVRLRPGTHNIVEIKTPQGTLQIKQPSANFYKNGVRAMVRKAGRNEIIHIHDINESHKYLKGEYDLELLTLPRRVFKNVTIKQSKTTTIEVESPGILNLRNTNKGYGSIYEVLSNGSQQWVFDLDHDQANMSLTMQPGDYKVVFRVDGAPGSKYTAIKTFRIRSGQSTTVSLF